MSENSGQFNQAFASGYGSLRMQCMCGRTYFQDDECAGDWEEGELQELRDRTRDQNSRTFAYEGPVRGLDIAGGLRVRGCQCGWLVSFENLIWFHRDEILKYIELRWRTDEAIVNRCGANVEAAKAARALAEQFSKRR